MATEKQVNPLWDEYILWLTLPESQRGIVATEVAWAEAHGLSDRITRRWKTFPSFQKRQSELLKTIVVKANHLPEVPAPEPVAVSEDNRDYLIIRAKILEDAKNGNQKAQEQFMKLFGKKWLDEENAAHNQDFSGLKLEELIVKSLIILGGDILETELTRLGWTVKQPVIE